MRKFVIQQNVLHFNCLILFGKMVLKFRNLFLVFYFIFLFFFTANSIVSWLADNPVRTLLSGFTIFGLYTAIPYLSFGDIGGISRFVYRENPKVGKYILYAVGTISLIFAFLLHLWLIAS